MSKEGSSISFGVGLLMGVVGGVIAAVLYAPKSGEETRKDVENVITDLAQKYTPEIKEAKRQALTSIDVMRYKLEQQYNKLNDSIKAKQLAKAKEKESSDYEVNEEAKMTPLLEFLLAAFIFTVIVVLIVLAIYLVKFIQETTLTMASVRQLTDLTTNELRPALKSINEVLATVSKVSNATNKQFELVRKILTTILGASCVALGTAKDKGFFGGLLSGFNLFRKKGDKKCQ